ncbi:hypothetical protein [Nonomuraea sp. B19D2]|uniref:hypothetical protein n=1 Tax=Nonomuraea sp. B19D2 TaxID=3159561 RepID=UPI0032DAB04F
MAVLTVQDEVHHDRAGVLDDHAYGGVAADELLILEDLVYAVDDALGSETVLHHQFSDVGEGFAYSVGSVKDLGSQVVGDFLIAGSGHRVMLYA